MASLTLKNVPEPTLTRLRDRAREERRSLNQQALHLLEEALRMEGSPAESRMRAQVESWRALAGRWRSNRPVREEIAKIYAVRTKGRNVDL
jgi:plasmid stability protein